MGENIDLSSLCVRAQQLISQGRIEGAINILGQVLQIDPEFSIAIGYRGTAYAMLKKYSLALPDLLRAIELGEQYAETYTSLATVHLELKQPDKALEYFSKALELDPEYPIAYYNRSRALYELGDAKAALVDLEKCLSLNVDENFKQAVLRRLESFQLEGGSGIEKR